MKILTISKKYDLFFLVFGIRFTVFLFQLFNNQIKYFLQDKITQKKYLL